MKLWIIYQSGFLFSKVIAETLQDRLENYIDVSVGKADKIDPSFIIEEKSDYLILGDVVNEPLPSVLMQNWVQKYGQIAKSNNLILKALSGFIISFNKKVKPDPVWVDFIHKNIMIEGINPPIICLHFGNYDLKLDSGVYEIIKDYSNKIIEFLTDISD